MDGIEKPCTDAGGHINTGYPAPHGTGKVVSIDLGNFVEDWNDLLNMASEEVRTVEEQATWIIRKYFADIEQRKVDAEVQMYADQSPAIQPITHGVNCRKVRHNIGDSGYLHGSSFVADRKYCGSCHILLFPETKAEVI